MTQANHYEPTPDKRAAWPAGKQPGVTPERWFEPAPEADPRSARAPGVGRGVVALIVATSMLGAVIGAGGTFLLLRQSGALALSTALPAPTLGVGVSVQSESDAVIAAYAQVSPSVVTLVSQAPTGQIVGSGIVYDAAGWILTNKHVVETASHIDVRLSDGRTFTGRLYGNDTLTDLAIVKIDGAIGLAPAPIGTSAALRVGQLTIAIGSPLGVDYPNSVTSGIISALGRDVTVTSDSQLGSGTNLHGLIQTDAAISSGNSGGPLVDASGRVIGVTTTLADTAEGIGFAIPIDIAKPIMQQALAGAKLARPYIGINYVSIDAGLYIAQKLPIAHGAWVHKEDNSGNSVEAVTPDGPADKAGIKTGDIITEIEGQAIDETNPLEDILVQYAPGRTISIELLRGSSYMTVLVTLGTRPESAS